MPKRKRKRRLWDTYRFPGFRPSPEVHGTFGEPDIRVIDLLRRSKKLSVAVVECIVDGMTAKLRSFEICRVPTFAFFWLLRFAESTAHGVVQ
jgi:hypothetical protein